MESKELAMQIAKLLDSKKATRVWQITSSLPPAHPPPM